MWGWLTEDREKGNFRMRAVLTIGPLVLKNLWIESGLMFSVQGHNITLFKIEYSKNKKPRSPRCEVFTFIINYLLTFN